MMLPQHQLASVQVWKFVAVCVSGHENWHGADVACVTVVCVVVCVNCTVALV